jgi:aminopeptidase
MDLRTRKLAQQVVKYSLGVEPDSHVIISGGIESQEFILELYKEIILRGAYPLVNISLPGMADFYYKHASETQLKKFPKLKMYEIENAQYSISINTTSNTRELTNCDSKKLMLRKKTLQPLVHYVNNTRDKLKGVLVAFPCQALAQEAEMSLNEYENFVYSACLVNWRALGRKMDKIKNKFEKGKEVYLKGENVDLKFSIKGKNCISAKGKHNMPDGEIYMAPVRESLNGWIKFEYPAIYSGKEIAGIYLKFLDGKVIESQADKNDQILKEVLKTDENSSFVGEFGIGCNPQIKRYTQNLLFDEKINGTIHLALGMAYKDNGGGNDSAIHWDIVKDMGKAQLILDGKIVQDNGVWKI